MLGFGALGQFALGQAGDLDVAAVVFVLDDSSSPERRKKRKKQQDKDFEELALKRERLRGTIYDAIHPPEVFEAPKFDVGIFADRRSPIVLPDDDMVRSVLMAQMLENHRRKMQADQEDEDDVAMLLGGR